MELTQWRVPYEASSTYELFRAAVNSSADISLWQCEVTVTLRCSFLVKIRWQYEHWKSGSVVVSPFAIMYYTWCHTILQGWSKRMWGLWVAQPKTLLHGRGTTSGRTSRKEGGKSILWHVTNSPLRIYKCRRFCAKFGVIAYGTVFTSEA